MRRENMAASFFLYFVKNYLWKWKIFFFLGNIFIWTTNTRRWPSCRLLNMHDSLFFFFFFFFGMREHLQFTKEEAQRR